MDLAVDVVIIGAGVVGLAVAAEVARTGRSVYVLEKNESFGRETSSRHSGVIHAGLYYLPGSLKARLCVEGNRLLYDLCRQYGIGHQRLGKIVVATEHAEIEELERLHQNGVASGAAGLEFLSRRQLQSLEPRIKALAGLHSPSTGIIDSFALMRLFAGLASAADAHFVYRAEVTSIKPRTPGYELVVQDSSGTSGLSARIVINCAGLSSDRIAAMAGIDIDAASYRLHYCKGQYFSVGNGKNRFVSRLIFPVPERHGAGLGVHVVFDLDRRMRLGPDTCYIGALDYTVDPGQRLAFYQSAVRFLPFLEPDDLEPESAGIRPKLQPENGPFHDFVIRHEADRGLPGFINLIGIESPGLTASPAIGKYVAAIVDEILVR